MRHYLEKSAVKNSDTWKGSKEIRAVFGKKRQADVLRIIALMGEFSKVKDFADIANHLLGREQGLTLEIAETFLPWVRKVCGKRVPAGEELRVFVRDGINLFLLKHRNAARKVERQGKMI